jgi:hypothetical protein
MAPRIRSIFKNLFTRAYLRDSFEKRTKNQKRWLSLEERTREGKDEL